VAGKQSAWSDSRKQLDILAQQGIDDMADILASRFSVAQTGGRGDRMRISVAGVDTLAAYARVSAYLAALTSVSDLQVDQVSGSDVRFSLALKGRLEDLTRTVRIGSVLETAPDGGPGNYRLRQ
jgi:hypothetical protein